MVISIVGLNGTSGDRELEDYFYNQCIEKSISIIDNRHRYEIRSVTNCGNFLQLILSNLSISDIVVLADIVFNVFKRFKSKDSKFLILGHSIVLNKNDSIEEIEAKIKCLKELKNIEEKDKRKAN